MANDARIATALPHHPKTRKLKRRLGGDGCWALICLFLWTAQNRPNGDLSGMDAEDIELAADWCGEEGAFVSALLDDSIGFLDGEPCSMSIHNWAEHNPWAATQPDRVASAKAAAKARWDRRAKKNGDPMKAEVSGSDADRIADSCEAHTTRMNPQCPNTNSYSNTNSNSNSNSIHKGEEAPAEQPAPTPAPSPSAGSGGELMAVTALCEELGVALAPAQRIMAAEHIAFTVREVGVEDLGVVIERIVGHAREARARGEPVDAWYIADGKWRNQQQNGTGGKQHGRGKAHENTVANLSGVNAWLAARTGRGIGTDSGADCYPLPQPEPGSGAPVIPGRL